MKTLIIGCQGYIGRHLHKRMPNSIGTHRQASPGVLQLDLACPDLFSLPLDWPSFSHAIIASGATKINFCETHKELSYRLNVEGTLSIARQLKEKGIFPIFFSTDYVFDGTAPPYDEESPLCPLNQYGRQKAILEQEIPKICGPDHLILRLGKVFGLQPGDGTLLDEMASRFAQNTPIRAASDQIFTPVFVDDAVEGILRLMSLKATGLYQICGNDTDSRHTIACRIGRFLNADPSLVQMISLADLNEPFKRPRNTGMKNEKYKAAAKLNPKSLMSCIQELANRYKNIVGATL